LSPQKISPIITPDPFASTYKVVSERTSSSHLKQLVGSYNAVQSSLAFNYPIPPVVFSFKI